ncbi:MAG TPA: right-handed parallel beta-helix repeat-containing protein, partial [Tahibacter sp.]|nr:right-handed parallel beta-helix repeat-containing protein [Tahibacter sp.]
GIAIVDASPTIRSNHILDNLGGQLGNGISAENSSALIESNRIAGNINTGVVGGGGGAGGIGLSGLRCEADPRLCAAEIRGNLIENNVVDSFDFGGGIAVYGGRPRIVGNLIRHNRARSGGGIVVLYDEGAQIENNLLVGNQSSAARGGGLYLATSLSNRGPQIVNNTFVDNQAVGGGSGIFAEVRVSTVRVVNNLIIGVGGGAIECGGSSTMPPLVAYNNAVAAAGPAYAGLCAASLGTDGNLSVAPSFVAPGDYRLRSGSAGIDAGSNDYSGEPVDFVGSPRIVAAAGTAAIVDIGAYELSDLLFAGDFETGTLRSADAAWTSRPMFARQYE